MDPFYQPMAKAMVWVLEVEANFIALTVGGLYTFKICVRISMVNHRTKDTSQASVPTIFLSKPIAKSLETDSPFIEYMNTSVSKAEHDQLPAVSSPSKSIIFHEVFLVGTAKVYVWIIDFSASNHFWSNSSNFSNCYMCSLLCMLA